MGRGNTTRRCPANPSCFSRHFTNKMMIRKTVYAKLETTSRMPTVPQSFALAEARLTFEFRFGKNSQIAGPAFGAREKSKTNPAHWPNRHNIFSGKTDIYSWLNLNRRRRSLFIVLKRPTAGFAAMVFPTNKTAVARRERRCQ